MSSSQYGNLPPTSSLGSLLFLGFPERIDQIDDFVKFAKEHDTTLNFPQKLMLMLTYVDDQDRKGNTIDCISWAHNGRSIIIRDREKLARDLLPLFLSSRGGGDNKFSSFTRKLYRWGFRQLNMPTKKAEKSNKKRHLIFGHEHFQRDDKALMSNLKSLTAAGTRRALTALKTRKRAKEDAQGKVLETCEASSSSEVSKMNVHPPHVPGVSHDKPALNVPPTAVGSNNMILGSSTKPLPLANGQASNTNANHAQHLNAIAQSSSNASQSVMNKSYLNLAASTLAAPAAPALTHTNNSLAADLENLMNRNALASLTAAVAAAAAVGNAKATSVNAFRAPPPPPPPQVPTLAGGLESLIASLTGSLPPSAWNTAATTNNIYRAPALTSPQMTTAGFAAELEKLVRKSANGSS